MLFLFVLCQSMRPVASPPLPHLRKKIPTQLSHLIFFFALTYEAFTPIKSPRIPRFILKSIAPTSPFLYLTHTYPNCCNKINTFNLFCFIILYIYIYIHTHTYTTAITELGLVISVSFCSSVILLNY